MMTQEQAMEVLNELIRSGSPEIANTWQNIIETHNRYFAPVVIVEEPKKKRRKRTSNLIGWPKGVTKQEYLTWKNEQVARGVSEGLNPHMYKTQRDSRVLATV